MKTSNRPSKFIPALTLIFGLLFTGSCKKDAGPIIVPPPNAPDISFSTAIQPILTANCATGGCHDALPAPASLDLSPGVSYANLVNVDAVNYSGTMRVKPFDTDSSVLYHKIFDTGVYGGLMPPAGALGATDLDLIKKWIDQGAQNN